MQAPDVWSDQDKVSKLGAEIKEVKENISVLDRWSSAIDDAGVALEIQDEDLIFESYEALNKVSKARYGSILAKEVDCTYSHAVKILQALQELGLVSFEKQGRIKLIKLTKKGKEIAEAIDGIKRTIAG